MIDPKRKALTKRIASHRTKIKRLERNVQDYRRLALSCAQWAMEERMKLAMALHERETLP